MRKKEERIVHLEFDPARPPALTRLQKRELAALARMTDAQIDYSDIPKLPASWLRKAVHGGLYRPIKRQMTVRLDADVLEWLKSRGAGHHRRLNQILRSAMLADLDQPALRASHPRPKRNLSTANERRT